MIDGPILMNQIMVHGKTGHRYVVAGTGKMKVVESMLLHKAWIPSVVYFAVDNHEQLFTRSETDFRRTFTRQT